MIVLAAMLITAGSAASVNSNSRMVAYVANWAPLPTGEQLRDVTTAVLAFATTYQGQAPSSAILPPTIIS